MRRKARMLFVTQDFPPNIYGGTGIYAYNFVRKLKELFHDKISIEVVTIKERHSCVSGLKPLDIPIRKIKLDFELYPFRNIEFCL